MAAVAVGLMVLAVSCDMEIIACIILVLAMLNLKAG